MDKDFDQLQIAYRLPWDEFVVWVASERSKAVKEGHKAALESEVVKGLVKMVSAAADGSSHCCEDCPCGHWQVDAEQALLNFNKFQEAQK